MRYWVRRWKRHYEILWKIKSSIAAVIFGVGSNGTDDRTAVVALSQQKVGASIDEPDPNDAENPASGVTRHQVEHHGQARVRALGCAMDWPLDLARC